MKLTCFTQCPCKGVKNPRDIHKKKKMFDDAMAKETTFVVELKEHFQSVINNHCQMSNTWG